MIGSVLFNHLGYRIGNHDSGMPVAKPHVNVVLDYDDNAY